LKGWANVGCRFATSIVRKVRRSWTRIGEPCKGLAVTLGLKRFFWTADFLDGAGGERRRWKSAEEEPSLERLGWSSAGM
jgi:hypothetical protein